MTTPADEMIQSISTLSVMPMVAQRVLTALRDQDRLSAQDLASLMARDPTLCAQVLREANSAYYGALEVKELLGAVVVLGFRRAAEIAVATSCIAAFGPQGDLRARFAWRRGLLVATIACRLARSTFGGGGDVLYVAGLMHDLGRSALRQCRPDVEREAFSEAMDDMEAYARCKDACDVDPADLGDALAQAWHLPTEARFVMMNHHDRSALRDAAATNDAKLSLLFVMIGKELADGVLDLTEREESIRQATKLLDAFSSLPKARVAREIEALAAELAERLDRENATPKLKATARAQIPRGTELEVMSLGS